MGWLIRPATLTDAASVAARMSPADAAEAWAAGRQTPLQAAETSVAMSVWSNVWLVDGVPGCIYGVATANLIDDTALVWMLSTDLVKRHSIAFLRNFKAEIGKMLEIYPTLYTAVDARHSVCLRWLRWTGFDVQEPAAFGAAGLPFCMVTLKEGSWAR